MKVVVIGKKDMTVGFSLAGVNEVFTPEDDYEAKKILDRSLETPDVGVILLSESIAEEIREHLRQKKKRREEIYPVIVELPDKEGPVKGKEDPLQDKIKRAVGVDISTQEEK